MTDIKVVGLIMLVIGIVSLVFCRRIANFIRPFYSMLGLNISEWVGIVGLAIPAIIFIYSGIQWIFF